MIQQLVDKHNLMWYGIMDERSAITVRLGILYQFYQNHQLENLVNSRYSHDGKMQWKCEEAHNLLQVKASNYSNILGEIWNHVFSKPLKIVV